MNYKIKETIDQFLSTKDEEVRRKCIFDLLDFQNIEITINDINGYISELYTFISKLNVLSHNFKSYELITQLKEEHQ